MALEEFPFPNNYNGKRVIYLYRHDKSQQGHTAVEAVAHL